MHKIAMYMRLSNEDDTLGESASIANQRAMLWQYIHQHAPQAQVTEFVDDGFSGTNFERPAVKKMLAQVQKGAFDCVIVKDLSRFGRNYLAVGTYLEQVFPQLHVRFIALNDGYDSQKNAQNTSGLDMPLRNFLYDLYSKDISRKVRSSKEILRKQGKCNSAFAFYGYRKCPENPLTLQIDPVASAVVFRIFSALSDGKTTAEMARILNAEAVPTPSQCRVLSSEIIHKNTWTTAMIRRIVSDERYTGKFVAGKTTRRIADQKKIKQVPREQWVVLENRLPAVVSEILFAQANTQIAKRAVSSYQVAKSRLFRKKIYCKSCGLSYQYKDTKQPYYFCATAKVAQTTCNTNPILQSELGQIVQEIMRMHLTILLTARQYQQMQQRCWQQKITQIEQKIIRFNVNKRHLDTQIYEAIMHNDSNDIVTAQKNLQSVACDIDYCSAQKRTYIACLQACPSTLQDAIDFTLVEQLITRIDVASDGGLTVHLRYESPT